MQYYLISFYWLKLIVPGNPVPMPVLQESLAGVPDAFLKKLVLIAAMVILKALNKDNQPLYDYTGSARIKFPGEAEKEMVAAKLEMGKNQQEMEPAKEQLKIVMNGEKRETAEALEQTRKEIEQSQNDLEETQNEMKEATMEKVTRYCPSKRDMAQSGEDMEQSKRPQSAIINDFIKEKIIEVKKALSSCKLSNEELIIPGITGLSG